MAVLMRLRLSVCPSVICLSFVCFRLEWTRHQDDPKAALSTNRETPKERTYLQKKSATLLKKRLRSCDALIEFDTIAFWLIRRHRNWVRSGHCVSAWQVGVKLKWRSCAQVHADGHLGKVLYLELTLSLLAHYSVLKIACWNWKVFNGLYLVWQYWKIYCSDGSVLRVKIKKMCSIHLDRWSRIHVWRTCCYWTVIKEMLR